VIAHAIEEPFSPLVIFKVPRQEGLCAPFEQIQPGRCPAISAEPVRKGTLIIFGLREAGSKPVGLDLFHVETLAFTIRKLRRKALA